MNNYNSTLYCMVKTILRDVDNNFRLFSKPKKSGKTLKIIQKFSDCNHSSENINKYMPKTFLKPQAIANEIYIKIWAHRNDRLI